MARRTGQSRLQHGLFATPLEDMIAEDNPVRVIDAFVDALDLQKAGFRAVEDSRMGAASYAPADLLKLYFYGYYNRIRSSRMLERECARNVELMWLIGRQAPSQRTISTFRTLKEVDKGTGAVLFDHRKALVQVFKQYNRFLDGLGLFGKKTFALDGTKIAAQNSKKKHLSEAKIARKIEKVDDRMDQYMDELDEADDMEKDFGDMSGQTLSILLALAEMDGRKAVLEGQKAMLEQAKAEDPGATQVCLTDPDARMLPINNEGMMQIAYNVQAAVDDKHCLIADFSVENQKDVHLLAPRAIAVKAEFGIGHDIEVLADKGYCSAKGIHECAEHGITTYVAFPEQTFRDRPKGFTKDDFRYDAEKDAYTCPSGNELGTSGTWHEKHGRQGHPQGRYRLYRCSFTVCSACPFREKCLSKANIEQRHGRTIERGEHEQALLDNKRRVLLHRDKYKRRQAIVEHPFGTIKRSWGCYFTLLRRKDRVAGEMAIAFSCYNLRRSVSILGVKGLIQALKSRFVAKTAFLSAFSAPVFFAARRRRPNFGAPTSKHAARSLAA